MEPTTELLSIGEGDRSPATPSQTREYLRAIVQELTAARQEISFRLTEVQQEVGELRAELSSHSVAAELRETTVAATSAEIAVLRAQVAEITNTLVDLQKPPRPGSRLAQVVPIVYGAVLSYAFYVLAENIVISGVAAAINSGGGWGSQLFVDAVVRSLLFAPVLLFLVKDLGDVVMIETKFPAKRELRYLYELTAASFYLSTFAFLARGSFLALFSFACVLFAGGMWCTELKNEYRKHRRNIAQLAKTLRMLHFIGGGMFLILIGTLRVVRPWFPYHQDPMSRMIAASLIFGLFTAWYTCYEYVPRKLHGRHVRLYLLSYLRIFNPRRWRWLMTLFAFVKKVLSPRRWRWFGDGRVR